MANTTRISCGHSSVVDAVSGHMSGHMRSLSASEYLPLSVKDHLVPEYTQGTESRGHTC